MAKVVTGKFLARDTTGTLNVTKSGAGAAADLQAIYFQVSRRNDESGTRRDRVGSAISYCTGFASWNGSAFDMGCVAHSSRNGQTTEEAQRYGDDTGCGVALNMFADPDAVTMDFRVTARITDGFTLTFDGVQANFEYHINYMAFYGSDWVSDLQVVTGPASAATTITTGFDCRNDVLHLVASHFAAFDETVGQNGAWLLGLARPVTGSDISFTAAGDTIDSSTTDLSVFKPGTTIRVTGTASNDGLYTVSTSSATSIAIVEDALTDESSGTAFTIWNQYALAYGADFGDLRGDPFARFSDRSILMNIFEGTLSSEHFLTDPTSTTYDIEHLSGGATNACLVLTISMPNTKVGFAEFTTPTSTGARTQTHPGFDRAPQAVLNLTSRMEAFNANVQDFRAGSHGVGIADADALAVSGTDITFDATGDTIDATSTDLSVFSVGDLIAVYGSSVAANNQLYKISAVTSTEIQVDTGTPGNEPWVNAIATTDASAGETILIIRGQFCAGFHNEDASLEVNCGYVMDEQAFHNLSDDGTAAEQAYISSLSLSGSDGQVNEFFHEVDAGASRLYVQIAIEEAVSGLTASPDFVQGRTFNPTTTKHLKPGFVQGQVLSPTTTKSVKPGVTQGQTFSPKVVHIARPDFVQGRIFDALGVVAGAAIPDFVQGRIFDPTTTKHLKPGIAQGRIFDPTTVKHLKPGLVQGRIFSPATTKIVKLDFVQGRVFDPTAAAMAQAAVCDFVQGQVFSPTTRKILTPDFVQGQIFSVEAGAKVEEDMGIEVSTTTVFNLAATFLNADLVNSSTEDSKTANTFRAIYDITRPEFLSAYPWCGAERHQKLNQYNVDTPEHWNFAFRLPFRFLRLITINPDRNQSDPEIEYRIEADAQFHERLLLTQESAVELLYVGNIENLNVLPYAVIKALAFQLALDSAAVFSKDSGDIQALEGRFERQLQRAKTQCSQQKSTRRFKDFDLVNSRFRRIR